MDTSFYKSDSLISKKFREFFFPSLLGALAGQLGIVIDSLMVGNFINADAMTGVSVCMPLEQILGSVSLMLSIGAGGMIAVAAGERKVEEANRVFSAVLILNALVGTIFLMLLLPFLPKVAQFLAGQEKITPLTYQYLQIMVWRTPFMMLLFAVGVLIRSDGMAKLASQGILLSQVVNIGLDLLLIGAMGMGLYGAAVATVASDISALGYIALRYRKSDKRTLRFVWASDGLKDFCRLSAELAKAGIPAAAATGLVSAKVWCIYRILEQAGGADAMQVYAVCMSILTFLSMVAEGSQEAMIPILGVLYGEKDYQGVRMLLRYVMKFSFTLALLFILLLLLFPQAALGLFNLAPEVIASGTTGFRLFCISLIGVLITFMMMYYYTTIGETTAATLLSVVEGFVVVIPAAWILGKVMGTLGVWISFVLGEIAGLAVLLLYMKTMHAKDAERYPDFYLIPTTRQELLFDVSVKAGQESAAALSRGAIEVLRENGVAEDIAAKAGIALEEITVNLTERESEKVRDLDVRIIRNGSHVVISLRDNGLPFNPMEYSPQEQEEYQTDGIMLFKAVARDIQYSRILSLNQTIIEI